MTTVGYGDIAPVTVIGQTIASFIMLIGYAIIAVPTGIVSAEMVKGDKKVDQNTQACRSCNDDEHADKLSTAISVVRLFKGFFAIWAYEKPNKNFLLS